MSATPEVIVARKLNQAKYALEDFNDSVKDLLKLAYAFIVLAVAMGFGLISPTNNAGHLVFCLLISLGLFSASLSICPDTFGRSAVTSLQVHGKRKVGGPGYPLNNVIPLFEGDISSVFVPQHVGDGCAGGFHSREPGFLGDFCTSAARLKLVLVRTPAARCWTTS